MWQLLAVALHSVIAAMCYYHTVGSCDVQLVLEPDVWATILGNAFPNVKGLQRIGLQHNDSREDYSIHPGYGLRWAFTQVCQNEDTTRRIRHGE